MFGYSIQQLLGATISSLIVPTELCDETECFSVSTTGKRGVRSEALGMREDGTQFPVSLLEGSLDISNKTVSEYIICREIAGRKQAGQADAQSLQERLEHEMQQKDRLQLLLDLNNQVASHLGLSQVFQAMSRELRRIFRCECIGLALPTDSGHELRQLLIDFPEGKGYFKEGTVFPMRAHPQDSPIAQPKQ